MPRSRTAKCTGHGRIGDFDVYVDQTTGVAYHVRTSFTLVRLNANFTGPEPDPSSSLVVELPRTPTSAEAPVLFSL